MAPAPPQNSAEFQNDLDPFAPVANVRRATGARDGSAAVLKARKAPVRRANMVVVVLVVLQEAVGR